MKYLLFVFFFAFSEAAPGYSDTSYSNNDIGQGSGASGGAYSYSGSAAGAGPGFPGGNFPGFVPYFQPFDFSTFFDQLNRQHQEFLKHGGGAFSYSHASSSPGSSAQAQSSITFNNSPGIRIQSLAAGQANAQSGYAAGPGSYAPGQGYFQNQGSFQGGAAGASSTSGSFGGDLGNRGGFVGGYGGGYSGPDGSYSFGGPVGNDGAFASGSIGPGGAHQTAAVYPENPNAPNVNTRFGGGSSGDGGGFKSVFTSSKSVTNNVDGKPQTFRQASTTINDNGKVTTYSAHNP